MGIINNCIILSAETYGKYINENNRSCNTIFSDGASAIYLDKKTKCKIISETYMSDGKGHDKLCLNLNKKLFMHGPAVFEFTKQAVPLAVKTLLKKSNLSLKDIDGFYFHQASKLVLDGIRQKLNIPEYKIMRSPATYGNKSHQLYQYCYVTQLKKRIKRKNQYCLWVLVLILFSWRYCKI